MNMLNADVTVSMQLREQEGLKRLKVGDLVTLCDGWRGLVVKHLTDHEIMLESISTNSEKRIITEAEEVKNFKSFLVKDSGNDFREDLLNQKIRPGDKITVAKGKHWPFLIMHGSYVLTVARVDYNPLFPEDSLIYCIDCYGLYLTITMSYQPMYAF